MAQCKFIIRKTGGAFAEGSAFRLVYLILFMWMASSI